MHVHGVIGSPSFAGFKGHSRQMLRFAADVPYAKQYARDVTGGLQFIAAEPRAASAGSTPSGYSSDILINRNSPYADRPVGG
jgi:hypothetical protein